MATCAWCGAASPDGFRFCGNCGTRLAEEAVKGNSVSATRILEQRGDQDDGDAPGQPTLARAESRP
jgi:hypothetical protein